MERVSLEEFRSSARRAFSWTSFDPEKRGDATIRDYEKELNEDLENIPDTDKAHYVAQYKKYFSSWLSARSNCSSSMITGGSGYNVRRAEKANITERNRIEDFFAWRDKALKAIAKRVRDSRTTSEKNKEEWHSLERNLLESAAVIHGIKTGTERGYNKALFVASIYKKTETYAKKGNTSIVNNAISCIRNFNETMGVVITERHKFFKLPELAESKREALKDKSERESTEFVCKGLTVISNFKDDRYQFIFDEKPSAEIIAELKHLAFKWSPRSGAWQRQMTDNAAVVIMQFIKKHNLRL